MIVLRGPTGVGKSTTAVEVAAAIGAEIVNYDSVQIYRGFDIGSAKPSQELRSRVPHHLYDILDANEEFNAADYAEMAREVCEAIRARNRIPLLVGGTGFYLRAFLHGLPEMAGRDERIRGRIDRISERPGGSDRLHRWLRRVDPESGDRIAANDRHRIQRALEVWVLTGRPISSWVRPGREAPSDGSMVQFALTLPRDDLNRLLDERVRLIYALGLVEETRALLERYASSCRPFSSIGYREAVEVLAGVRTLSDAIAVTSRRTRAYAKRQMTWLRAEQGVQWIDVPGEGSSAAGILDILSGHEGLSEFKTSGQ